MFKYSILLNALAVLEEGAGFRREPACWKQNQLGRVSPGISIAVGAAGVHRTEPRARDNPGGPDPPDSLQGGFFFLRCRLPEKTKAGFLQQALLLPV